MASLVTIVICLLLWQRAKTIDQDERGHAERRALYVGLWPPTFWLIGARRSSATSTVTGARGANRQSVAAQHGTPHRRPAGGACP
jgi:hypothetical protein